MSHQADDRYRNPAADGALRARKPWRTPLVISSSATEDTKKFSIHSYEGGSYPTTHGPS
jgi:hypothetical protein